MVIEFSHENVRKEICTRNARIWLEPEGYIKVVYTPGSDETLEQAEDNLGALEKICCGKQYPVLINPGPHKSMSRDARVYYVKNSPKYASAVAVLIGSPFARVLSTFLKSLNQAVNKDKFQVAFFVSEKEALNWLKKFID